MSTNFTTYYDILGVKRTASPEEIKTAYRQAVKKYHPDHLAGDVQDSHLFNLIQQAYDTLSDPEKREDFDRSLDEALGEKPRSTHTPPPPPRDTTTRPQSASSYAPFVDAPPPPYDNGRYITSEAYWASLREQPHFYNTTYWNLPGLSPVQRLCAMGWGVFMWGLFFWFWSLAPKNLVETIPTIIPIFHLPVPLIAIISFIGLAYSQRIWKHFMLSARPLSKWFLASVPLIITVGMYLAAGWIEIGLALAVAMLSLAFLWTIVKAAFSGYFNTPVYH